MLHDFTVLPGSRAGSQTPAACWCPSFALIHAPASQKSSERARGTFYPLFCNTLVDVVWRDSDNLARLYGPVWTYRDGLPV